MTSASAASGQGSSVPPRRILVWARPDRPVPRQAARAAAERLRDLGVTVLSALEDESIEELVAPSTQALLAEADLAIVFGGDGAMVSAVRAAAPFGTPLIGVNYGTFGFLTEIDADDLDAALVALVAGRFDIDERMMLTTDSTGHAPSLAANDVVLKASDPARMLDLLVSVDGEQIAEIPADGVIVASPTGSTAYSLSAGGPVVVPHLPCLVLAPICPHTLTTRPILLHPDARVEIEMRASPRTSPGAIVSVDGQLNAEIEPGATVHVRRADIVMRLARLQRAMFFTSLRGKLRWGLPK